MAMLEDSGLRTRAIGMRRLAAWFVAIFAISQVPLYASDYPGILDFANHLARVHLLARLDRDVELQRYYTYAFAFAPNLAVDVVAPPIARLLGADLGLKIFVSLGTLLLASGAAALSIALTQRVSYLALGGFLFAGSFVLHAGLFNYIAGLGAALWLLAGWMRVGPTKSVPQLLLFATAATVVYACHLSALGVYAVAVMGLEVAALRRAGGPSARVAWKRLLAAASQFAPSGLLHVLAFASGGDGIVPGGYPVTPPSLVDKFVLFFGGMVYVFSPYRVAGAVLAACVLMLVAFGLRQGLLAWKLPSRLVCAVLALLALVLPPAGFGSLMLDARLLLPLAIAFFAGLAFRDPRRDFDRRVPIGVMACTLIANGMCYWHWTRSDPFVTELREAMRAFPVGAKVATVELRVMPGLPALSTAWAVIDRSALVSSLYLRPFNPFWAAYRTEYVGLAALARLDRPQAARAPIGDLLSRFDYAVVFGEPSDTGRYAGSARSVLVSDRFRVVAP